MKKLVIGVILGFGLSMGMRSAHSVLFNHYVTECRGSDEFLQCANEKMGYLNLLSTLSGFPMYFFDKWEWFG